MLNESLADLRITYFRGRFAFLSNFFPCLVSYGGVVFKSVEHAYQYSKAVSPASNEALAVMTAPTAKQAKALGRWLVMRPDWELIRISVMEELLRSKFTNPELRKLLAATGSTPIISGGQHHETFWGVCLCPHCSDQLQHNHLGKLLMKIRGELK